MRDAIVISLLARLWVEYPSFGALRHDGRWLALEDTDEGWTRRRLAPTQVRRARQSLVRLGLFEVEQHFFHGRKVCHYRPTAALWDLVSNRAEVRAYSAEAMAGNRAEVREPNRADLRESNRAEVRGTQNQEDYQETVQVVPTPTPAVSATGKPAAEVDALARRAVDHLARRMVDLGIGWQWEDAHAAADDLWRPLRDALLRDEYLPHHIDNPWSALDTALDHLAPRAVNAGLLEEDEDIWTEEDL